MLWLVGVRSRICVSLVDLALVASVFPYEYETTTLSQVHVPIERDMQWGTSGKGMEKKRYRLIKMSTCKTHPAIQDATSAPMTPNHCPLKLQSGVPED
jgi:hypothetical protein